MPRIRPPAPSRALPATVHDLEAQRIVARRVTLADEVDRVLKELFDDAEFRRYREALKGEDAVEGNIMIDDTMAAQMIREKGTEMNLRLVKAAKLDALCIALRRAESWYNVSRKQRKSAVGE